MSPRTVAGTMLADLGATNAGGGILFIELDFGSGTQYLTNAPVNISWNSQTWVAVGGAIAVAGTQERWEPGSSARLSLSGVDPSILALVLGVQSRGRLCKIWWAHYDQTAGTILADPVLLFAGLMSDAFDITESHDPNTGAGTVDIATRISERVSDVGRLRGIRTNVHSHQASGIPGAATDTFFAPTTGLLGTRIFWNTEAPSQHTLPPPGGQAPTIPGDPSRPPPPAWSPSAPGSPPPPTPKTPYVPLMPGGPPGT